MRKWHKTCISFLSLLLLFCKTEAVPQNKAIVIVANHIDYDGEYRGYFERKGILVFYASPEKFFPFRRYKTILIIGGPDAPQTGEIVSQILSSSQIDSLRRKGNRGFFERKDVWAEGQSVFVVGGWDRHATSEAMWENMSRISSSITESYFSASGEILWMKDDIEGAFAKAEIEDRLVLVYVWTSWCKWCQKMEEEVFSDARVREVLARYYVPVRLDYEKSANAEFAHGYYIWGTPAFLIFDKNKKKIGFMDGYQETERFLSRLLKYASPQGF